MIRLCNWEDVRACPAPSKKWKQTADDAAMQISDRIAAVLDAWQMDHRVLDRIDREIIDVFAKDFGLLQHQVDDIESMFSIIDYAYSCSCSFTKVAMDYGQ